MQLPEHARLRALDRRGAWVVVEQSELAEGVSRPVGLDSFAGQLREVHPIHAAARAESAETRCGVTSQAGFGGGASAAVAQQTLEDISKAANGRHMGARSDSSQQHEAHHALTRDPRMWWRGSERCGGGRGAWWRGAVWRER